MVEDNISVLKKSKLFAETEKTTGFDYQYQRPAARILSY